MPPPLHFVDLLTVPLKNFIELQDEFWRARVEEKIPDTILLVEHPPTISVNAWRGYDDLKFLRRTPGELARCGIPIVFLRRGGSIALHAPGILGIYPIMRAPSPETITDFLEKFIRGTFLNHNHSLHLSVFPPRLPLYSNLHPKEQTKYRGLWWKDVKVGTRGICLSHGVSRFGMNLNINPDPELLDLIYPCGITDYQFGSLQKDAQQPWNVSDVKEMLIKG